MKRTSIISLQGALEEEGSSAKVKRKGGYAHLIFRHARLDIMEDPSDPEQVLIYLRNPLDNGRYSDWILDRSHLATLAKSKSWIKQLVEWVLEYETNPSVPPSSDHLLPDISVVKVQPPVQQKPLGDQPKERYRDKIEPPEPCEFEHTDQLHPGERAVQLASVPGFSRFMPYYHVTNHGRVWGKGALIGTYPQNGDAENRKTWEQRLSATVALSHAYGAGSTTSEQIRRVVGVAFVPMPIELAAEYKQAIEAYKQAVVEGRHKKHNARTRWWNKRANNLVHLDGNWENCRADNLRWVPGDLTTPAWRRWKKEHGSDLPRKEWVMGQQRRLLSHEYPTVLVEERDPPTDAPTPVPVEQTAEKQQGQERKKQRPKLDMEACLGILEGWSKGERITNLAKKYGRDSSTITRLITGFSTHRNRKPMYRDVPPEARKTALQKRRESGIPDDKSCKIIEDHY